MIIKQKERESSFELLRIIAQVMIVYYHILLFSTYPLSGDNFFKALWIPLHVGVPLFVLISGYFGIKPSIKGFVKLAGMTFVLQLPLVVQNYLGGGGIKSILKGCLFISQTDFWFIRTYVFLYLLSPILNTFLKQISLRRRLLLLLVLLFISDYIGNVGSDNSLKEGYNIVTFMLFYVVGNTLYKFLDRLSCISSRTWMWCYLIFNVVFVALFAVIGFNSAPACLFFLWGVFGYNSIGLLISSVLFFMIFTKLKFSSPLVNNIAKASLAMYIIHGVFLFNVIKPVADWLFEYCNYFSVSIAIFLLSVLVVAACTLVYWMLTPIWRLIERLGTWMQNKFDLGVRAITYKIECSK